MSLRVTKSELPFSSSRLFAIGDIHGCVQELEILLLYLINRMGLTTEDVVIFVGDYIDRGPSSREVIDLLLEFRGNYPNTYFLRGNHEDMFLEYMGFKSAAAAPFIINGGSRTLSSYGISLALGPEEVREQLGTEHLKFFQELLLSVTFGNWLFVHAGVQPGVPVEEQEDIDLLWIREKFLKTPHELPYTVVYGHTPFPRVMVDMPNKIGIDTGLVYGNRLTCVELTQGRLIEVKKGKRTVSDMKLPLFF